MTFGVTGFHSSPTGWGGKMRGMLLFKLAREIEGFCLDVAPSITFARLWINAENLLEHLPEGEATEVKLNIEFGKTNFN